MKIVIVDFDKMIFVRTTLRTILRHLNIEYDNDIMYKYPSWK